MIDILIISFFTAYVVRVLLYEDRVSHYGPWPSRIAKVVRVSRRDPQNPEERFAEFTHPVTLFDRVRQLLTRCYEIDPESNQWFIRESRMEMWTCPKCLTFWVVSVLAIPYFLLAGLSIVLLPFYVGAAYGLSYLIYQKSE